MVFVLEPKVVIEQTGVDISVPYIDEAKCEQASASELFSLLKQQNVLLRQLSEQFALKTANYEEIGRAHV